MMFASIPEFEIESQDSPSKLRYMPAILVQSTEAWYIVSIWLKEPHSKPSTMLFSSMELVLDAYSDLQPASIDQILCVPPAAPSGHAFGCTHAVARVGRSLIDGDWLTVLEDESGVLRDCVTSNPLDAKHSPSDWALTL